MQWLRWIRQMLRRFGPGAGKVLLGCGGALLVVAAGFWLHAWAVNRPLVRATATVSENVARFAPGGGVIYSPRLRFRTGDGELVQVITSGGSEEMEFPAGTMLPVRYPAGRPDAAVIATAWRVYPAALTCGILGVVLVDLGLIFWFLTRDGRA